MSKSLKLYGVAAISAAATLTGAYNFADRFVADMPDVPVLMGEAPGNPDLLFISAANAQEAAAPEGERLGLGREATPEEIASWDIDVRPDGLGLPEGSGDVSTGEEVFVEQCAVCHGDFGEGVGRWPVLTGGFGTLDRARPVKTTGSYWPFLSTMYDYIHRAMPFGHAQSLEPDQVYSIVAYLLYMNDLVEDDFVLSKENFAEFKMPNEDGFFMDDRVEVEFPEFTKEPCMENCKDTVEITMRAEVLDVTPEETAAKKAAAEAAEGADEAGMDTQDRNDPLEGSEGTEPPIAEGTTEDEAEQATSTLAAGNDGEIPPKATGMPVEIDQALADEGEKVFRKCKACHQVGEGATNRTGPELNAVVGRPVAAVEDFRYSNTMKQMGDEGMVWDHDNLAAFLADPRGFAKGTKMSFAGLRSEDDVNAVIEYLKTFHE